VKVATAAVTVLAATGMTGTAEAHRLGPLQVENGATAYSTCSSGTQTADGSAVRWGIVASNRLPMHALLRFEHLLHGRRYFRVRDTGSAIMRLDIFMPSCRDAINFGRRRIAYRVVVHPR
jgi:3D (Asp-Asp-Asp) domain-containing protein